MLSKSAPLLYSKGDQGKQHPGQASNDEINHFGSGGSRLFFPLWQVIKAK